MNAHKQEVRLVSPPEGVQKVMFPILAFIGQMLGYRAEYEKYRS